MSRIGKMPIPVPGAVQVDVTDGVVKVTGPRGELSRQIPTSMTIERDNGTLLIERPSDEPAGHADSIFGTLNPLKMTPFSSWPGLSRA